MCVQLYANGMEIVPIGRATQMEMNMLRLERALPRFGDHTSEKTDKKVCVVLDRVVAKVENGREH